jgi:hypothetical protein
MGAEVPNCRSFFVVVTALLPSWWLQVGYWFCIKVIGLSLKYGNYQCVLHKSCI